MTKRESIWLHRRKDALVVITPTFSGPVKPYQVDTAGVTELVHNQTKSRVKDLEPVVAADIF